MKIMEDEINSSDSEVDEKHHNKLLENLISLDSKQPVKKPSRTEPTTQISEYNLVKSITGNKDSVKLYELTKPLKDTSTHIQLKKDVKKTEKKTKTLDKPLDKPLADKVRRSVGYEKNKEEISRWEPVVTSHRASTYLSFPLNYNTKVDINAKRDTEWKVKSDLEKAIENIEKESKVEIYEIEPEIEAPLTLQEMIERRKEMAKLRRFQSYQEMKARMQNKIKSKKYRRILRKEKAKQEMKDFEKLQQNNPEEALKKLEEIEKSRALERANLRHKSTGKWAKGQQIRAKYDKESRQVLAEQLAISKELTKKKQEVESSESEDENVESQDGELEFNFWLKKPQKVENLNVDLMPENKLKLNDKKGNFKVNQKNEEKVKKDNFKKIEADEEDKQDIKEIKIKNEKIKRISNKRKTLGEVIKPKKSKKEKIKFCGMSGDWAVDDSYVDELAHKLEDKFKEKLLMKSNKLKKVYQEDKTIKKVKKSNTNLITKRSLKKNLRMKNNLKQKKVTKNDLTLNKIKKPIIDEPLEENQTTPNDKLSELQAILNSTNENSNVNKLESNIKLAPINLESSKPDLFSTNDNEDNDMKGIIAEAFEDDDLIDDFMKEKQEEINKDTPQDVDLFMPGWGSWGGNNIKNTKKRKRFIMKFPKNLPRRDDNKGDLIINENASKAIKAHAVSEVPFPFKSVGDFETCIKAPIGNTFVPETAFRRLTKPGVTTKLGTIIEPVDEDVLMRKMKKFEKVFKIKK